MQLITPYAARVFALYRMVYFPCYLFLKTKQNNDKKTPNAFTTYEEKLGFSTIKYWLHPMYLSVFGNFVITTKGILSAR